MLCAGEGSQLGFEFSDFGAKDVLPVFEHARNASIDIGFQPGVLRLQVTEFD